MRKWVNVEECLIIDKDLFCGNQRSVVELRLKSAHCRSILFAQKECTSNSIFVSPLLVLLKIAKNELDIVVTSKMELEVGKCGW